MKISTQLDRQVPRLNPFAFASETDFRFILLIVSVVGSSLYIYNYLYWSFQRVQGKIGPLTALVSSCVSKIDPTDSSTSGLTNWETWASSEKIVNQCLEPMTQISLQASSWAILGAGLLLLFAGIIYRLFPLLIIRWERLARLDKQPGSGEIINYLLNLCQETELSHPPVFLLRPPRRIDQLSGRAFGCLGHHYLVLYGGLVKKFQNRNQDKTQLLSVRGVLLHELAHLKNEDVDKTYFSVAISISFGIFALMPFLVSWLFGSTLAEMMNAGWRILCLTALVYLTFAAILRVREFYADVRASTWDLEGEALEQVFSHLQPPQRTGLQAILASILQHLPFVRANQGQTLLRLHPLPAERYRTLHETHHLLQMNLWEAFGTGIAITVAFDSIDRLLLDFLPLVLGKNYSPAFPALITGLVFAPLAVGIVGLGIWRSTFASLFQPQTPVRAGQLGIAFGLGLLTGDFLAFSHSDLGSSHFVNRVMGLEWANPLIQMTSTSLSILWIILLLGSLYFFFRWIGHGASVWLEVAEVSRSPRPFYRVGLAIAGIWLTLWLGFMFLIQSFLSLLPNAVLLHSDSTEVFLSFMFFLPFALVSTLTIHPLTLGSLVSLWLFPLTAWFWRERVAKAPISHWVLLDSESPLPFSPRSHQLLPEDALRSGLIGGVIFCVSLLIIRLVLVLLLPEGTRETDLYKLMLYFIGNIGLAALIQAGIALFVASRIQWMGIFHGLFAAFIAGSIMTISALGLNLIFGGTIEPRFVWQTFTQIVNGGALLSLLTFLGFFLVTRHS